MVNKKTRRHSGRVYPRCKIPQKVLDKEGIVLEEYWDDWVDYRDGLRDPTKLREKNGKTQKRSRV